MAQTIGQLLQKEREQRGLTIADVAHDTHIHANTIRGLEADDYSVFSSTTYARSFLQLYSRHLEVDAGDALHDFDSVSENLSSGKFSYLGSATNDIEPGEIIHPHQDLSHTVPYGDERRQAFPLFLALVVFLLLLIIPIFYFIGKKAESMEEAKSIFKDAISSTKATAVTDSNQSENNDKPSPTEPLVVSENPSITQTPEKKSRPHRFSTPLPTVEPNPVTPASTLPIKAIPVTPKDTNLRRTKTAQNRN